MSQFCGSVEATVWQRWLVVDLVGLDPPDGVDVEEAVVRLLRRVLPAVEREPCVVLRDLVVATGVPVAVVDRRKREDVTRIARRCRRATSCREQPANSE